MPLVNPPPPNSGRGIRRGANLWYGPSGAFQTSVLFANSLALAPIDIAIGATLSSLTAEVTSAGSANSVVRLGLYADDGTGWLPGTRIVDAGTIDGTSATVQEIVLGATVDLPAGRYWVGGAGQGGPVTQPTMRCIAVTGNTPNMPGTTNTPNSFNQGASAAASGALPATISAYAVTSVVPRVMLRLT